MVVKDKLEKISQLYSQEVNIFNPTLQSAKFQQYENKLKYQYQNSVNFEQTLLIPYALEKDLT